MTYVMPPDYIDEEVRINVTDIVAQESLYKFKLTVENLSCTNYLTYEMNKTCFELQNVGKYYPNGRKKVIIIEPGARKSVVISVKVGSPTPHARFVLILEGLSRGVPSDSPMEIEGFIVNQGETFTYEVEPLKMELVKSDFKKEMYSLQSELSMASRSASITELIVFDPNKLTAKGSTGAASVLPGDTKPIAISVDDAEKFKFNVACADPSIQLELNQAFHFVPLESLDVPAFNITNGIVPVVPLEVKLCDAQTHDSKGEIKITITSEVGCFRFFMLGEEMTTDFTSKFTFHMNESAKKVRLMLENGYVVEKTILAKADYKALYYAVEEKKGEYNLKYLVFASEVADGVTLGFQGADEVKCEDEITTLEFKLISGLTVQEVTGTEVLYKECGSEQVKMISKMKILAVQYADGSYDKFDYNGGSKQGMGITRSRKETTDKHKLATKGTNPNNQSSFVIGPP